PRITSREWRGVVMYHSPRCCRQARCARPDARRARIVSKGHYESQIDRFNARDWPLPESVNFLRARVQGETSAGSGREGRLLLASHGTLAHHAASVISSNQSITRLS